MTVFVIILVSVIVVGILAALVVGTRGRGGSDVAEAPPAPGDTTVPTVAAPPAPVEETVPTAAAPPEAAPTVAAPEKTAAAPPALRDRLGKVRGLFTGVVGSVRSKGSIEPEVWGDLEEALLRADVGVSTTDALLEALRTRVRAREIVGGDALLEALRADLLELVRANDVPGEVGHPPQVFDRSLRFDDEVDVTNVWLFVGVNGVGKTTTVGKVAREQTARGRSVLLAAADTFRAAAAEQLVQWGERSGAEVVRGAEGGDPSAIVFDAVQRAAARGNDLVLADTAGRLHTKVNLVEELKKIRRIADRDPGRVTEVLLVLDATTGQNALAQARQFTGAVAVTGVVLTKLDGTAKGGVVIAIQRDLGVPVKLVGLGEGPDDLVAFEPEAFVDALVGEG
jgi:fused signal recognition particle receptor